WPGSSTAAWAWSTACTACTSTSYPSTYRWQVSCDRASVGRLRPLPRLGAGRSVRLVPAAAATVPGAPVHPAAPGSGEDQRQPAGGPADERVLDDHPP